MPSTRKRDTDKLAWAWVEHTTPEQISRSELESSYKIGLKECTNCKRNCWNNPQCLFGFGEEKIFKSEPPQVPPMQDVLTEFRQPKQYVGLKNLGATCYVNSLIQVWFHNEDMRRIIYKWDLMENMEEVTHMEECAKNDTVYYPITVLGQLQYIFAMMQFGNRQFLDPTSLAISLSLDTNTQQDAQEFAKLLLSHLEEKIQENCDLKESLTKLHCGFYSYVNKCNTCGSEYFTPTAFYELDLQLAPTLEDAIRNYLTEEELDGQNQYYCTACKRKRDAKRTISLTDLPKTLNIQLLRFVYERSTARKKKLNKYIQFPKVLDMSEYLKCAPDTHVYQLVAVLSHKGTMANSGHYIATIRSSAGDWYEFSDDKVEKTEIKWIDDNTTEPRKNDKRGRVPKGYISSNTAYMLVYEKINTNNDSSNKVKSNEKMSEENAKVSETNSSQGASKLNGVAHVAHRGMGSREEQVNEDLEFEHWEVCHKTREIVRRENEEHHLSLVASYEKLQNEVEEECEKRQLVIDFYNIIKNTPEITKSRYAWIPTEWLSKWIKKTISESVPPIENESLLCQHKLLDLKKLNRVKLVPLKAANLLYEKYKVDIKLDENSLCSICVKQKCRLLRSKIQLEKDHKEIHELMKLFKEPQQLNVQCFIVGTNSFKCWKKLALGILVDEIEHESDDEAHASHQDDMNNDNNHSENEDNKDAIPLSAEESNIINFNEDLLCEHGELKISDSGTKIVPESVWTILKKYFPDCKEYPVGSAVCSQCQEKAANALKATESYKVEAKRQKDELQDLYYIKRRNEIVNDKQKDQIFYVVEKGFLDAWRSFIRFAESHKKTPPSSIANSLLLCEGHHGFLYQCSMNNVPYTVVSSEEWKKLTSFYKADFEIRMTFRNDGTLLSDPARCDACILERITRERLESLKYDSASIYVKYIEDSENKSESDDASSSKKAKLYNTRPTRTRNAHELKVSSTMRLKDLKIMVMNFCGAGPYDQHMILDGHELLGDDHTLASLEIYPGAVLTLRVDTPLESEDIDLDVETTDSRSPEKGFKGTGLVPR